MQGIKWRSVPWWGWCIAVVLLLTVIGKVKGGGGDHCVVYRYDAIVGGGKETVCFGSDGGVYNP